MPQRQGIGVDSFGGQVIDPTKNVLDLVQAAIRRQDDLREAETRRVNDMVQAERRLTTELAAQKQIFDLELAKVIRSSQDAASLLLATQLKEVKTDLQTELRSLNEFRWQTGGRSQGFGLSSGFIVQVITSLAGVAAIIGVVLATRH